MHEKHEVDDEVDRVVRDSQWAKYQPWLRLQARLQIDSHFKGKFDESDIAQQTMIEAWRAQSDFRGQSEPERLAWLRTILARVLGHEIRRYRGTKKRDIARERSLQQSIANSSQVLGQFVATNSVTPSQIAQQQEAESELATALERLPDEYREVIIRRNMQMQTHEQIAEALGKSAAAIRMVWIRALRRLKQEMNAQNE
ncbi:MAG: sigma-70 family RNA polymerase sigma factor [Planctomycetota bacterium]